MTIRKASQTHLPCAAGLPVLILFSAWCGAALASSDIRQPCPELVARSDASLNDILDKKATTHSLRALDKEDSETDSKHEAEEAESPDTGARAIATRLPGASANEVPRFRRHMFRTDI